MMLRIAILTLLASCWPSNQSSDYECTSNDQCSSDRYCDRGFCVELTIDAPLPCPPDCDTCDLINRDCTMICNNPNGCDNVDCPAGFDCIIQCSANNSCDNVDCSEAQSCQITCAGTSSCDSIECGNGQCNINCTGGSSCSQVDCTSSCQCDVTCGTNATCGTSCRDAPVAPNKCTEDGTASTPCDSSFDAACDSC